MPNQYKTDFDRGTAAVQEAAGGFVKKLKDQTKEAMENASEVAGQAKDRAQEIASNVAGQVKDKAQEWAHITADRAEDVGHEVTAMIRRYPLQALLVGFGIGLLLGRVSRT